MRRRNRWKEEQECRETLRGRNQLGFGNGKKKGSREKRMENLKGGCEQEKWVNLNRAKFEKWEY